MTTHAIHTSSLDEPFNNAAVIEGTLIKAFPDAWHGTFYFDPERNTCPEKESSAVYRIISNELGTTQSRRPLQQFANAVRAILKDANALTLPFTGMGARTYCYLMTESPLVDRPARLREFFGDAALRNQDIKAVDRAFDEFVARHELGHSINIFRPLLHRYATRRAHEGMSDSYAVLGMIRDHGQAIYPFVGLLIKARLHQVAGLEESNAHYNTVDTIRRTIAFAREKGVPGLRAMDEHALFAAAHRITTDGQRDDAKPFRSRSPSDKPLYLA